MKRSVNLLVLLLFIFITIQSCSAVEITLAKSSYQPGETLQAEIVGSFVDSLAINNIYLRKEGSPKAITVEKNLIFQNSKYYLYMTPLPKETGNFSIQIEDTGYMEGGELKSATIIKKIDIKQTTNPSVYFNPGFIYATDDFSINVKSLYTSQTVNAFFKASGETQSIFISEDSQVTFRFSIADLETQDSTITINGYTLPIFIFHELAPSEKTCSVNKGIVCEDDEICNQTEIIAKDTDFCCLGACEPAPECVPDCTSKQCGDDGCGGICGDCIEDFGDEFFCDSDFICANATIPCIQRCDITGEQGCFGDYFKICGNWDEDNCLEWGNSTLCEYGCQEDICLSKPGIKKLIFRSVSKTNPVLSARVIPDKDYPFQAQLENTGTEPLYNISIYTEQGFIVSPNLISLNPGAREVISIFVNIDGTTVEEGDRIKDNLIAEVGNLNFTFPIYLEITLEAVNEIIAGTSITTSYTCADQRGVQCPTGTECALDTINSLDVSACCTDECIEPSSSTTAWIIGLLIIGIVVTFIVIGYVKSKKQTTSPESKMDERKKRFEQRMRPPINEVSGGLGKI